jgi:6-phosphofructokinase 1
MARIAVWAAGGGAPGVEEAVAAFSRTVEVVRVADGRPQGADGVLVLGGEGALSAAAALGKTGVRVVHVPATVENDIPGTDVCLGVDTALNAILRRGAAASGPTILDVPGRLTGYLALMGAAGCRAAGALLVERPFPWDRLGAALKAGARPLLLRSEGTGAGADAAARLGALVPGTEVRVESLAAALRAEPPSIFDRVMAHRLGEAAAEVLLAGGGGRMIAWRGGNCIPVPIEEVAGRRRQVLPEAFEFGKAMGVLFE